ncbi:MAG: PD-(D/E)XK nuclease family protein, partial [Betaproteobacteria bacterium]
TLEAKIAAAVRAGSTEVDRRRWQSLPAPVVAGEAQRLAATIGAWLEHGERGRPPFTVRETELRSPLVLGGLELTLQIDRVDTLPEGGVAIVDYKSGRTVAPKRWFADRPTGTQVGLYALAWKARDPDTPVRAVAYVRVKAGEIGVDGLAADVAVWPALDAPADLRMAALPDWTAVEARFAATLGDLVDDFRAGDARVAPRDAGACRYCDQKPLCRVRALDDEAVASGDADG